MRPGRRSRLLAALVALAALPALPACGRGSAAHAEEAAAVAPSAPARPASDRLPEDPVLGAKATAEWRTFMEKEERERRLHFDRGRLPQHRIVLGLLTATRTRLDRAKTRAVIAAIRDRLPRVADEVRRRIAALDPWGVNSNLLADYDAMLKTLADGYPAARLAALAGDGTSLAALRADLDARQKKISDWLTEAATAEDE